MFVRRKHNKSGKTYEQTKRVLGGTVTVIFYDTTTMYFESREDDIRVPGWSKDGKNALDIRLMYHRLFNRIEAHVCICFVAYTIMLELEHILKAAGSKISLDRARFLAEKIYQIDYVNPYDGNQKSVILHTKEQPKVTELLKIISEHC